LLLLLLPLPEHEPAARCQDTNLLPAASKRNCCCCYFRCLDTNLLLLLQPLPEHQPVAHCLDTNFLLLFPSA